MKIYKSWWDYSKYYINIGEAMDGWAARYAKGKGRGQQIHIDDIHINDDDTYGQDKKIHKILVDLECVPSDFSPEVFVADSISKDKDVVVSIVDYIIISYFIHGLSEMVIKKNVRLMKKKDYLTVSFTNREYQKEIIDSFIALNDNNIKALFIPPRGGKSITTSYYLMKRNKTSILIVSGKPNEVRDAWKKLPNQFFDFHNMHFAIKSIQGIGAAVGDDEQFKTILDYLLEITQDYDAIVLDEFHWGVWHEKYTSALQQLGKEIILVTGTPNVPAKIYDSISPTHVKSISNETLIQNKICTRLSMCHLTYNGNEIEMEKLQSHEQADFLEKLFDRQSQFYKKMQNAFVVVKSVEAASNLCKITERFIGLKTVDLTAAWRSKIDAKYRKLSLEEVVNQVLIDNEANGDKTIFVTISRAMCGVSVKNVNYLIWLVDQENMGINRMEQSNARVAMYVPGKESFIFFISASLMIGASLEYNPTLTNVNNLLAESYANQNFEVRKLETISRLDVEFGMWKPIPDYEKDFIIKHKEDFFKGVNKSQVNGLVDMLIRELDFIDGLSTSKPNKIAESLFDTGEIYAKGNGKKKGVSAKEPKEKKENVLSPQQVLDMMLLLKLTDGKLLDKFIGKNNLKKLVIVYLKHEHLFEDYFKHVNSIEDYEAMRAVSSIVFKKFPMPKDGFDTYFNKHLNNKDNFGTLNFDFYIYMKNHDCNVKLFDIMNIWTEDHIEYLQVNFNIKVVDSMKFDVIIANPPYNMKSNLHTKILEKSLNIAKKSIMLLPPDFLKTNSQNKHEKFRTAFENSLIEVEMSKDLCKAFTDIWFEQELAIVILEKNKGKIDYDAFMKDINLRQERDDLINELKKCNWKNFKSIKDNLETFDNNKKQFAINIATFIGSLTGKQKLIKPGDNWSPTKNSWDKVIYVKNKKIAENIINSFDLMIIKKLNLALKAGNNTGRNALEELKMLNDYSQHITEDEYIAQMGISNLLSKIEKLAKRSLEFREIGNNKMISDMRKYYGL